LPMDGLTLAAEIVKAAVWPVSTLVLALFFRGEIRDIFRSLVAFLGRVKKVGFNDLSAELDPLLSDPILSSPGVTIPRDQRREAQTDPKAAILRGWDDIEETLQSLAVEQGLPAGDIVQNSAHLVEKKRIKASFQVLVLRLHSIYELIARGEGDSVDAALAEKFVRLTNAMVAFAKQNPKTS
jgi:hypothetical protein